MLSLDEQTLLESVENDEWQSVPNREQEIQRYQSYAWAQLLEEISQALELSRERVRQIESKALQKLHQSKRPNEVWNYLELLSKVILDFGFWIDN